MLTKKQMQLLCPVNRKRVLELLEKIPNSSSYDSAKYASEVSNLVSVMKNNKVNYVVGFMFSEDHSSVALIRKNRPDWQKGLLNGPGGKIESGEDPQAAMAREFKEETGFAGELTWHHFMNMHGADFNISFFATTGDLTKLSSPEDEKLEILKIEDVRLNNTCMIDNLHWCIGLALDHLKDGRPEFAIVGYP